MTSAELYRADMTHNVTDTVVYLRVDLVVGSCVTNAFKSRNASATTRSVLFARASSNSTRAFDRARRFVTMMRVAARRQLPRHPRHCRALEETVRGCEARCPQTTAR